MMESLEEADIMLGFTERQPEAYRGTDERRTGDRFPIERDLTYKVLSARTGAELGSGKTINLSSTGVLFTTQDALTPGKRLELSISWPVQLDGKCGLKLVARGRIVRVRAKAIAVDIERYEFRTLGHRGLSPVVAPGKPGTATSV